MKTINSLRISLMILIAGLSFTNLLAQTVLPGSTRNYSLNADNSAQPGYSYTWSVTNGTGVGTPVVQNPNDASTDIVWPSEEGTYIISLIESRYGCDRENTFTVTVVGTSIAFEAIASAECPGADYDIALTNPGVAFPITVTYNAYGTNGLTKVITDATDLFLTIPATDRTDTGADYTRILTLTGATGQGGGTISIGANATNTHTVRFIPAINTIIQN